MTTTIRDQRPAEDEVLRLLRSLTFGSLEITVHDGRIAQIERRERIRFDKPAPR